MLVKRLDDLALFWSISEYTCKRVWADKWQCCHTFAASAVRIVPCASLRRAQPRDRPVNSTRSATLYIQMNTHMLHLLSHAYVCRGRKVMLDCGIHPGLHGASSLPYLTNEDLDEISVALITHFHLDHCAAVPYLIGHTTFKACMRHHAPAAKHTPTALLPLTAVPGPHESTLDA